MSLIPTPPVSLSIGDGAPPQQTPLGGGMAHVTDARSEAWKRRSVGISSVAGGYTRRGGDDIRVAVWAMGGPLTLTLVCGVIHTAAAFVGCLDSTTTQWGLLLGRGLCNSYVLSLGPVSAGLILVYLALYRLKSEKLPEHSLLVLSGLLFLWWTAGTAVTTFSLLVIPDTLYIATWASLLYSGLILNAEWTQFQMLTKSFFSLEAHTRVTFYVALASVVNTASSIAACVQRECTGITGYSIAVGPVSLLMCAALFFTLPGSLAKLDRPIAVALALWWAVDVGVVTIGNGVFLYAGNGLLSSWAACVLSFAVAQAKVFPVSENLLNDML